MGRWGQGPGREGQRKEGPNVGPGSSLNQLLCSEQGQYHPLANATPERKGRDGRQHPLCQPAHQPVTSGS